jgi:predicted RNase H-like HicB family nuclease
VTLLIKQEGKEYTALCLELDIASCGSTESEAAASLKGLIELYVEDCVAEGEIPIPLRPVALDALRGFLSPADRQGKLRLTARQESFPHHVLA